MEECKYRLPCGRCEKFNKDCDAPKDNDLSNNTKHWCEHEWVYNDAEVADYTENGKRRYHLRRRCIHCGLVHEKLSTDKYW